MKTRDVATRLGITRQGVHKLDSTLRPIRRANGYRAYDPAIVEIVACQRERIETARINATLDVASAVRGAE
jgi:DNA-binding transcriptional MerR regulator